MECVFCDIVRGRQNAYTLYEDDSHMAILDKYPLVRGHSLIIPKRHYSVLPEMDARSVGKLFSLVSLVAPAILKATGTEAFNVGQNNGEAAKQVVPHVHVHIIPRRPDERVDWSARLVLSEGQFQDLAGRIRRLLQ